MRILVIWEELSVEPLLLHIEDSWNGVSIWWGPWAPPRWGILVRLYLGRARTQARWEIMLWERLGNTWRIWLDRRRFRHLCLLSVRRYRFCEWRFVLKMSHSCWLAPCSGVVVHRVTGCERVSAGAQIPKWQRKWHSVEMSLFLGCWFGLQVQEAAICRKAKCDADLKPVTAWIPPISLCPHFVSSSLLYGGPQVPKWIKLIHD